MSGRNTIIARRTSPHSVLLSTLGFFPLLDLYFRVYFLLSLQKNKYRFAFSRNMAVHACSYLVDSISKLKIDIDNAIVPLLHFPSMPN